MGKLLVIAGWCVGCLMFFCLGRGAVIACVLGWMDGYRLQVVFQGGILLVSLLVCFAGFQRFILGRLKKVQQTRNQNDASPDCGRSRQFDRFGMLRVTDMKIKPGAIAYWGLVAFGSTAFAALVTCWGYYKYTAPYNVALAEYNAKVKTRQAAIDESDRIQVRVLDADCYHLLYHYAQRGSVMGLGSAVASGYAPCEMCRPPIAVLPGLPNAPREPVSPLTESFASLTVGLSIGWAAHLKLSRA